MPPPTNWTPRNEAAAARLRRLTADSHTIGVRISAELEYGAAYQEMVRAGLVPQIRARYRIIGGPS